jgi:hypothetical protein
MQGLPAPPPLPVLSPPPPQPKSKPTPAPTPTPAASAALPALPALAAMPALAAAPPPPPPPAAHATNAHAMNAVLAPPAGAEYTALPAAPRPAAHTPAAAPAAAPLQPHLTAGASAMAAAVANGAAMCWRVGWCASFRLVYILCVHRLDADGTEGEAGRAVRAVLNVLEDPAPVAGNGVAGGGVAGGGGKPACACLGAGKMRVWREAPLSKQAARRAGPSCAMVGGGRAQFCAGLLLVGEAHAQPRFVVRACGSRAFSRQCAVTCAWYMICAVVYARDVSSLLLVRSTVLHGEVPQCRVHAHASGG